MTTCTRRQVSSDGSISRHPPDCGGAPSPPKTRKTAAVMAAIVAPSTARRNMVNMAQSVVANAPLKPIAEKRDRKPIALNPETPGDTQRVAAESLLFVGLGRVELPTSPNSEASC